MKIYYAHPLTLFGSRRELKDLATLRSLGFDPYNPNNEGVARQYEAARNRQEKNPTFDAFEYIFKPLVFSCEALAFRSFADCRIGAGVVKECRWAADAGLPIIELPTIHSVRLMTVQETRERLEQWRDLRRPDWDSKMDWLGLDPRDPNA